MPNTKLTQKQIRFCQAYVSNHGNGAKAVLEAGYKVKNNSSSVASVIASENLIKPNVQEYIKKLFNLSGLDETEVEHEHAYLIRQRDDLTTKLKAIELYYKVIGRLDNRQDSYTSNIQVQSAIEHVMSFFPE